VERKTLTQSINQATSAATWWRRQRQRGVTSYSCHRSVSIHRVKWRHIYISMVTIRSPFC